MARLAVGVGEGSGLGVELGKGRADASGRLVAEGERVRVGVAVAAGAVSLAVGLRPATIFCSCMPSTTATNRVSNTTAAANNPLKSGPASRKTRLSPC